MKKIQALALACSICIAGQAQITAINPSTIGGFESGPDFASNGWSVINPPTLNNQWVVNNTAPSYSGSNGAHVSNDGTAYAYTLNAARTCHFLRDVTVPPGATSITLSFYWKGMGQIGADRLLVYTATTSVTPLANTPVSPATGIAGATLVWTQPSTSAAYTLATVSLPSTLAGTTVRVIFTWQNDASGGTSPGAAVDNISFTYECGTPANITGNVPLCVGANIPLSNIFTGGTWSSSNTAVGTVSSGGVLTGVAAGTTTITYTSGTCQSTAVVSVSPLPAAITGHDTVCLGSTTAFANSVIGGTWSSSYPAIATVLSTSGVITGNVVGMSIITYTMPGGCYTTDTVHVVDVPGSITGAMAVCPGTSTVLSCTPSGGVWTSLNPGSASVNATGKVTGIAADVAIIKYSSPVGGCPAFATVTINPLPAPIISKDIMCAQGTDTAYNATAGGTWSSLTPSLATISAAGHITPLAGGVAVIKYTLATSCAITKSITLNALPTPTVYFDGPTNTLFTDTTYESYQWYHDLFGEVIGATTFKTAGIYNGKYYVEVSDEKGCLGKSALFDYNTSMGLENVKGVTDLQIFPNPANSVINIKTTATVNIVISTMDGKTLMSRQGAGQMHINALPQGIYLITAYDAAGLKVAVQLLTKQ